MISKKNRNLDRKSNFQQEIKITKIETVVENQNFVQKWKLGPIILPKRKLFFFFGEKERKWEEEVIW